MLMVITMKKNLMMIMMMMMMLMMTSWLKINFDLHCIFGLLPCI